VNIINQELSFYNLGSSNMYVLTETINQALYDKARQVFNRRFDFKPWAIVYPENTHDVSLMVRLAVLSNREIRVRGGGHDHEGECSATDALLLDMSKLKQFELNSCNEDVVASIGVGWIFKDLIVPLVKAGRSIPHGTCQTVGITGFTLGGGWGPWTRRYGMCCEHLVGATIVLGDGSVKELNEDSNNHDDLDLLWALRGGGGFSYGIITELKIRTFEIPEQAHKFEAVWKTKPALQVLEGWEQAIEQDNSPNLVGTNLQIIAKPIDHQAVEESVHECHFFGYYLGDDDAIRAAIEHWFPDCPPDHLKVWEDEENSHLLFSAWGRFLPGQSGAPRDLDSVSLDNVHEFPLEEDIPAPHKISSRLVNAQGLGRDGRINLISSLRSNLLDRRGQALGIISYVTLGAISGPFYRDYKSDLGAAFPYKDRPYTIQYQTWWDTESESSPIETQKQGINRYTNRAMDWIEQCRRSDFPQTSGAFISFKDAGIATETYFMHNYERLVEIKTRLSCDPTNKFRSRKTIV